MTAHEQRSRLAVFAPVPPAASGIADYVADLVPLLIHNWDVEVFTPTASPGVLKGCPTYPVEAWDERDAADPYDLNIYQIGNDTAHGPVIARALATPGLLVLHDTVLHPARVASHLKTGDLDGYRQMAETASAAGTSLAHLVAAGLGSPAMYWRFPMCEDLVRGSRLTVVHGETLAAWLRALVPSAAISVVTH